MLKYFSMQGSYEAGTAGRSPVAGGPGRLEPIEDAGTIGRAVAVLTRGFPRRREAFWLRGLQRADGATRRWGSGPLGQLLVSGEGDAGVLLTFRSPRPPVGEHAQTVCNFSSWYVDPPQRWAAPLMLKRTLKQEAGALVTDLTATRPVATLNATLGFELWSEGAIVAAAAPWAALANPPGYAVHEYEDARVLLAASGQALAEDHRSLGCIVAVLETPTDASPLVLRRRWGASARLLYAESRRSAVAALPGLMRLLLRRGIGLAMIDAAAELCPRGALYRCGRRRFHRGPVAADRLDYAYSEFVFLDI